MSLKYLKQESIPVGCIPPACSLGVVLSEGGVVLLRGYCPWGLCCPRGVVLSRGCCPERKYCPGGWCCPGAGALSVRGGAV